MIDASTHGIPSLTSIDISQRLARSLKRSTIIHHDANHCSTENSVFAAVLVPLVTIDDSWHLLFIRRAENENDHHSGQVAFPGGRYESDDISLENTALREAWEEVGVKPQDVQLLGHLNDHVSTTGFRIRPVVGSMPWPYTLNIDEKEVSRCFTIPLGWLATPTNRDIRQRRPFKGDALIPTIYFREYAGETLWGATARITVELLETLLEQ